MTEQATTHEVGQLAQETIDALAVPFAAEQVRWKPQAINRDKTRALAVAYVDARDVAERLDRATHGDWGFDFELLSNGHIKGYLTVCGCTRCDMGDCDQQNPKGDVSDALKRCAVLFGVGRYLYRLPATWVDYNAETKRLVTEPKLPAWALPRVDVGKAQPPTSAAAPEKIDAAFPSQADALAWSLEQGAFETVAQAVEAYDALKEFASPKNAAEMGGLWRGHIAAQLAIVAEAEVQE